MNFSVIIPVYNADKYLSKCLDSLLKQTYTNFEIVLIDDGSFDNSPQICDKYEKEYPGKFRVIHQNNQGQLVARCNGISNSTGEYCIFLDSDDFLNENCLNELNCIIEKYNNPDMVIYSFLYEKQDGSTVDAKKIFEGEKIYKDKKELYKLFFTSTLLNNVWTKAVRREVLMQCEIDIERYKSLRCSEDRLHSMEMLTRAEIVVYTEKVLYRYRLVEDSITRQFTPKAIDRFNDSALYGITADYLKKWQLDLPEWKERMDADWVDHAVYVFDQFYTKCRDKKSVIDYDWNSFIPDEVRTRYTKNQYINDVKKNYMTWILYKKRSSIDSYVKKREFRKKVKSLIKKG